MRHRVAGNHLGRASDQRKALLRSLATELLKHDEIITTFAKAKALQPTVERLISKGKKGHLPDYNDVLKHSKSGDAKAASKLAHRVHLHRQVSSFIYDRKVTKRLFDEIAPRYLERKGGYTRIVKAGFRKGDATPMAIIQLV